MKKRISDGQDRRAFDDSWVAKRALLSSAENVLDAFEVNMIHCNLMVEIFLLPTGFAFLGSMSCSNSFLA